MRRPDLLALSLAFIPTPSLADADLDTARRHVREFYETGRPGFAMHDTNEKAPSEQQAPAHLGTLREDGSWPDIAYEDKARSSWPAARHVNRMAALAARAVNEKGDARERLLAGLHRAFAFWMKSDPKCPNWWYNEIGAPKQLLLAAALMGEALSPGEKEWLREVIGPRCRIGMTGQNRIWLAENTLMLGLILDDDGMVTRAAEAIRDEVRVSTKEGIQPDFSFHQHGAQQQFGNYGLAFATEVARVAGILRDTRRALSGEQLAVFRRYLLEGQNWVCWRGHYDLGACGRQFMPGAITGKTRGIAAAMREAALIDPEKRDDYLAFVARNRPEAPNDLLGFRFFRRSDYAVHRLKDLCFTLKMSSNRVIGAETTNGENKCGYHIADGMTPVYRAGDEYADLLPAWDWRRLPGVTAPQSPLPSFGTTRVPVDFVGGVSDGRVGVAALDYAKDGVKARKSWFFTPSGLVALGSAIESPGRAPVVTTVNQCLLRGAVVEREGFVEHDGVRYTPLAGTRFDLKTGPVTGHWNRIFNNPDTPRAEVSVGRFLLGVEHGARPAGAAYAYAITPAGTAPLPGEIDDTAGVHSAPLGGNRRGFVFFAPGECRGVRVDRPCVLIHDPAERRFLVADPTQQLASLKITWGADTRVVAFPVGADAGAPATVAE